ncbi:TraR/DksA C4-type zinc finger protein [Pseudomonas sp. MGal98]|uniref:TraR/DksA C4-type zinc finger protein n=1 Tax=Pseudomonas sp. MGal98 TaxID=3162460 RepID=UPI0032EB041B
MADIADIANDRMQQELDHRLAQYRQAQPCPVSEECEECGDPIPFERVQALAKMPCLRCVECQGFHERRGGGR